MREVVEECGISCEIRVVTDLDRFAELGVFAIPALVIDDRVEAVGRIPKPPELEKLLRAFSTGSGTHASTG